MNGLRLFLMVRDAVLIIITAGVFCRLITLVFS